ncbi:MAG: hypothetical protein HQL69_24195 [Magnetococcales bacterium]|nr:hypothetical protein [Magnetococcales bacterium]
MYRHLITFNWVLGSVFFVIAIFYSKYNDHKIENKNKYAIQIIEEIYKIEKLREESGKKYIYFDLGEIPSSLHKIVSVERYKEAGFVYEVKQDDNGGKLVIRAHASDDSILNGELPPTTHSLIKNIKDGKVIRSYEEKNITKSEASK